LHFTQNGGATASLSFSGDAVAIYGTVSPDHGNFSVSVDGQTTEAGAGADGLARVLHPQILLYFANDLGPGQHNLVLTADPQQVGQQNTGRFMDIDAVNVYTASGGSGNNTAGGSTMPGNRNSSGNNNSGSGHKSPLSKPLLIGAIAGAVGGLLFFIALLLLFLYRRRRRSKKGRTSLYSPKTPDLPIQKPEMVEAGYSADAKTQPPSVSRSHTRGSSFPKRSIYAPSVRSNRDSYDGSVYSVVSTSRLISDPPPVPKLYLPRPPPPAVNGGRSGGYGQRSNQGPPMRPFRPPSLQLSPVPLR